MGAKMRAKLVSFGQRLPFFMKRIINTVAVVAICFGFACGEKSTQPSSATARDAQAVATTQKLCFESVSGRDTFSVSLTITPAGDVSGTLDYLFYQKDSATGTLKGKKQGDVIIADYSYTIEGSQQLEEVRFKLQGNTLLRQQGELKELPDGKLVQKNPDSAPYNEAFAQISCQ